MAGARRALPTSPAGSAVALVEAVLAARDPAERMAAVASRTAAMDEAEVRRLLVSVVSVAAWCARALGHCRQVPVSSVLGQLRELAGGGGS